MSFRAASLLHHLPRPSNLRLPTLPRPACNIPRLNAFRSPQPLRQRQFTTQSDASPPPTGLKLLMARYGRTALITYFAISTFDLALCYVAVQQGGAEFVGRVEALVAKYITGGRRFSLGGMQDDVGDADESTQPGDGGEKSVQGPSVIATLAVAYAIHKLLVPIRVPITAAITPGVARWMVRRGWMKMPPGGMGKKMKDAVVANKGGK